MNANFELALDASIMQQAHYDIWARLPATNDLSVAERLRDDAHLEAWLSYSAQADAHWRAMRFDAAVDRPMGTGPDTAPDSHARSISSQ